MINKFFKQKEEKNEYESIKRNDIVFFPAFYNGYGFIQTNELLSKVFYSPMPFTNDTWMPSRSLRLKYTADLLPILRRHNITKIFFANLLDDFDIELFRASPIKEVYGLVRSSTFLPYEFRQSSREQDYEMWITKYATKVFTSSEYMKRNVPYDAEVVGLPIVQENIDCEKEKDNTIIFNHRLHKVKNPHFLFELPKNIRERIILSCPKWVLQYVKEFETGFNRLILTPPRHEYEALLRKAKYGIICSHQEPFGISVTECLSYGICYFCIDSENCAHIEFMPKELLFKDQKELTEKIKYYDANPKERLAIVKKAQDGLKKFHAKNWVTNLLKKL